VIDLELFGGRRAFVAHLRERVRYAVGAYSGMGAVDWSAVRRLAFVCKGNICRSPYAEARARAMGMDAVSFGLEATDGTTANEDAIRVAATRGIDLGPHRSLKTAAEHLRSGDLVLLFEPRHLERFTQLHGDAGVTASLLGLWARPVRPLVWDPYGKSTRYFEECFAVIDSGLAEVARKMKAAQA
jgi:protein-tyrosine phosphatase